MLSKRLKMLREEKGLLQKDIAKILNITTSAYGYYEQGERDPGTHVLEILANFYKVSIDYMMGRTNNRSEPSGIVTGTGNGSFSFDKDIPQEVREEIIDYAEYLIKKHKEGK